MTDHTMSTAAAISALRERVESAISSLPRGAAERRSPDLDVTVPLAAIDAVLAVVSYPPADDVREALAKRIADEVEYRVRTAVTLAMNGHEYEQHVAQGRESVAAILAEVRPYGMVTPTPEKWAAQMDAERVRQIEHGYDDAHDAEHGVDHLLNWAIDYARRGNNLAAATMARCALRLPRGTVTDTEVAAALDARAIMSTRHIFLYATERCRCGEEWSDAHWMRFILEAAKEARL